MLTIYAFSSLPPMAVGLSRDLRVFWAVEELGLDYRVHPIDAMQGGLNGDDLLAVQPFGNIPAIDDGGFTLFESGAIVFYLAEKAGRLLPDDAQGRALARQWAFTALNTLEPQTLNLLAIDSFYADQPWAKERRPAQAALAVKHLTVMERLIGDGPYLMGEDFTVPDILMATVLRQVQHTDLLKEMPNLTAYKARCEARPAWQKVLASYEERLAA
jgi:glutathione S-transferase